jgi:hypothetical protein
MTNLAILQRPPISILIRQDCFQLVSSYPKGSDFYHEDEWTDLIPKKLQLVSSQIKSVHFLLRPSAVCQIHCTQKLLPRISWEFFDIHSR